MASKACTPGARDGGDPKFEIVEEKQLHRRYLTLFDRKIRFPAQQGRKVGVLNKACLHPVPGHVPTSGHWSISSREQQGFCLGIS